MALRTESSERDCEEVHRWAILDLWARVGAYVSLYRHKSVFRKLSRRARVFPNTLVAHGDGIVAMHGNMAGKAGKSAHMMCPTLGRQSSDACEGVRGCKYVSRKGKETDPYSILQ